MLALTIGFIHTKDTHEISMVVFNIIRSKAVCLGRGFNNSKGTRHMWLNNKQGRVRYISPQCLGVGLTTSYWIFPRKYSVREKSHKPLHINLTCDSNPARFIRSDSTMYIGPNIILRAHDSWQADSWSNRPLNTGTGSSISDRFYFNTWRLQWRLRRFHERLTTISLFISIKGGTIFSDD